MTLLLRLSVFLDNLWYKKNVLRWFLWPFSLLYAAGFFLHRNYTRIFKKQEFSVPIIVIGNLTVGGVGKTPLVISLACRLMSQGLKVGIVSRGYGSRTSAYPYEVNPNDEAVKTGDEPLLIHLKTKCPVIIAPKRTQAVRYLIDKYQPDIIISDDGLQHHAMGRAVEIAVINGERWLGNEMLLPAGPLREGKSRLKKVDFVVVNSVSSLHPQPLPQAREGLGVRVFNMHTTLATLYQLQSQKPTKISELQSPIAAFAGIAHPERFFNSLKELGLIFNPYIFPDHYHFSSRDFQIAEKTVVMTEKDAVKCRSFLNPKMVVLPIEAHLDAKFWQALSIHPRLAHIFNKKNKFEECSENNIYT